MGAALAAGLAAGCPAAAAARSRLWVASGSLTGTYTNSVAWNNCADTGDTTAIATSHDSLTLDAKISPGKPQAFSRGIALVINMRPGGHWSITGSYPPRHEQPTGDIVCGPQQSFSCSGPVRREGEARAVLVFRPNGRSLAGNFLTGPSFHERSPNQDAACPLGDTNTSPLSGLDDTEIEVDALAESDAHPASLVASPSKFKGKKAFTVKRTAHPFLGCPRAYYTQCTETGAITLTLRFSHPR